jgi:hypothetical protein
MRTSSKPKSDVLIGVAPLVWWFFRGTWRELDAEGLALFKRALALQEDAYRTGKTAPSRTALPDQEAVKLLAEAGFTRADVEQLARLDKLAVAEGCAVIVKFYSTSARIPTERGGPLARWLLISVL